MKLFTRFRILNATRSMVGEVGVERVTMRGIAARANLTAPAIYRHFRNKRALLDAVIASGYDELGRTMLRANRTPSGARGLRTAVDQAVNFAIRYPQLTRMMLAPQTSDDPPIRRLSAQVERCMKEGSMPYGNPETIAHILWAQMRGQLAMRQPAAADAIRWLYGQSVEYVLARAA
ncbi:MAG TPA: helix-turn-helix domain-containing protein [Myxococcales bacterium]|nr:helix-turn-helix domain-containing protein [Myxococcales bacterium]